MISYKRPTTIKGLSVQRRLPRLGKIRLGVKKVSQKSGKEYPTETSYFVVPPEVAKVYGEAPTELDVMLPVEDSCVTFPQAYEMYGSGKGLKCVGDGETAYRHNEKTQDIEEVECPCENLEKDCKQRAHLRVILPKVNIGGVYQVDTSSYNSIVDLNSGMDYIRAMVGRVALVPLILKRQAIETHHDGKKQVHYAMRLELQADINFINQLRENTTRILMQSAQYSLPPPTVENPALGEWAVAVDDAADVAENTVPTPEPATEPAPPPEKKISTHDYIKHIVFPKLKELGILTRAEADKKLAAYDKDARFETMSMEQLESFHASIAEEQEAIFKG